MVCSISVAMRSMFDHRVVKFDLSLINSFSREACEAERIYNPGHVDYFTGLIRSGECWDNMNAVRECVNPNGILREIMNGMEGVIEGT